MTRFEKIKKSRKKMGLRDKILLIISICLLITAIVTLLIKPVQDYLRNKMVDDIVLQIENDTIDHEKNRQNHENKSENFSIPTMTFTVEKDKMVVPGEEIEGFTDEEYDVDRILSDMPKDVTLTAIGTLRIPSIELNLPLLNKADIIDLRYGAGMFSGTAKPGEKGNFVVLGHNMRAYGSLFNRLHEVKIGEEILVTLLNKMTYTYVVDEIISPLDPMKLPEYIDIDSGSGNQITLITCTNANGSHRRLVIGHLKSE